MFKRSTRVLALCLGFVGLLVGLGLVTRSQGVPAAEAGLPDSRKPVLLAMSGQLHTVETNANTVGQLLAEQKITLDATHRTSLPLDANVSAYTLVKVTERTEQVITSQEPIPFETVKREDESLDDGEVQTLQQGAEGSRETTEIVYYEDGQPVERHQLSSQVVKEPVSQIEALGTGLVAYRGDSRIRYSTKLEMMTTGYSSQEPGLSDYTATGALARYGIIAVDPRVIPLGTRVYVDGYGFAIAADTGSAIKGNHIDLCFDTLDEALNYGVEYRTVYILRE